MIDRSRGVTRGQSVVSEKLERARSFRKTMTGAESILWNALRGNGLDGLHFRRQQIIDGFIADFYCSKRKLVVEIDGAIHERQVEQDICRSKVFEERRLKVLRFSNDDVEKRLAWVLERIVECR